MEERNLDPNLIDDCLKYLKNKLKNRSVYEEEIILSRLPAYIRNQILYHRNKDAIESICILKQFKNINHLAYLYKALIPAFYPQDQFIITEGFKARGIFMITSGKVELMVKDDRGLNSGSWRASRMNKYHISASHSLAGTVMAHFIVDQQRRGSHPHFSFVEEPVEPYRVLCVKEKFDLLGHETLLRGADSFEYRARCADDVRGYFMTSDKITEICSDVPVLGLLLQRAIVESILESDRRSTERRYVKFEEELRLRGHLNRRSSVLPSGAGKSAPHELRLLALIPGVLPHWDRVSPNKGTDNGPQTNPGLAFQTESLRPPGAALRRVASCPALQEHDVPFGPERRIRSLSLQSRDIVAWEEVKLTMGEEIFVVSPMDDQKRTENVKDLVVAFEEAKIK